MLFDNRRILDHNGQPFRNGDEGNLRNGFQAQGYGEFPLPQILTYNQILSSGDQAYWHNRWDEALRHARTSALTMRRDAFLMSLLQERKLAVASIPWELEVPDEKDPRQRLVRDTLKRAIEGIADLRRIIYALLEAVWYGRYAVEVEWDWIQIHGKKIMTVVDWFPINGDKLGWQFDGTPYVLVNSGVINNQRSDIELINTTAGGQGFLLKGTWRDHFLIHRHEMDDADYFDGEQAAGVWGVGVRSRIFWMDYVRRNYREWIDTFLERVGLGITVWYYDAANPAALGAVQNAAKVQSRRANLFVPLFTDGKGSPKGLLERIETPVNGVDALRMLTENIEQKIERFVVGQEASSKNDGSTGLGNAEGAKFQVDTKRQITLFDAHNLAETLTGNARHPGLVYLMQRWSFPETMPDKPDGFAVKFKFVVESAESEKKLAAIEKLVSFGIPVKADEARKAAGVTKPDPGDELIEMPQPGMGGPPGMPGAPGEPPPGGPMGGDEGGDFQPPYPEEETPDDILGAGGAEQLRRSRLPFQFSTPKAKPPKAPTAGVKAKVPTAPIPSPDDLISNKAHAHNPTTNKPAPLGWTIYHGPHGGSGWKNSLTGKIIYATSGQSPFNKPGAKVKPENQVQADPVQAKLKKKQGDLALARWYADTWNLQEELGLVVSEKEQEEAGLELYGSGVAIHKPDDGDKWLVVRSDKEPVRTMEQYAFNPNQPRSPKPQGVTIAGRYFSPGKFIPKEFTEVATPAQKAAIGEKKETSKGERMAKGPNDHKATRARAEEHMGKTEGPELRHAKQAYKALMRNHGELLMHRVDELAEDAEKALSAIGDTNPDAKAKLEQKLGAYGHMTDWAKAHGMTDEVAPGHEDMEPMWVRDVKTESLDELEEKMDAGIESSGLSPELKELNKKRTLEAMGKFGGKAIERINRNMKAVKYYPDKWALLAEGVKRYGEGQRNNIFGCVGMYDPRDGTMLLVGTDRGERMTGTNLHEMVHALDGPNWEHSQSEEWDEAYKAEIANGQVSHYGSSKNGREHNKDLMEGFAEFGRVLHQGEKSLEEIQQKFPQSWAYWEKEGLLPDEAGKMGNGDMAAPAKENPSAAGKVQKAGMNFMTKKYQEPEKDDIVNHYVGAFNDSPSTPEDVKDADQVNKELEDAESEFRVIPDGNGKWRAAHLDELDDEYGDDWTIQVNPLTGHPDISTDSYWNDVDGLDGDEISASYVHAFNDESESKATHHELMIANQEMKDAGSEYELAFDKARGAWIAVKRQDDEDEPNNPPAKEKVSDSDTPQAMKEGFTSLSKLKG